MTSLAKRQIHDRLAVARALYRRAHLAIGLGLTTNARSLAIKAAIRHHQARQLLRDLSTDRLRS